MRPLSQNEVPPRRLSATPFDGRSERAASTRSQVPQPDPNVQVSVVIADEHHLVRDGVKYSLARSTQPAYAVAAETTDAAQTVRAVGRLLPDLLVIDITMPDGSGLEAIDRSLRTHPQLAVVVLTMRDQPPFVREALHVGARGYVLKDGQPAELLLALRLALRGASYLAPGLATALATTAAPPARATTLSPREREVLRLIALGYTYCEIARAMNFSERTVKNYRLKVVETLGLSSRAELTQWALRNGLVTVPEAA